MDLRYATTSAASQSRRVSFARDGWTKQNAAEVVLVEGREISISNPGKVLFPEPGYTKLDLVRYYLAVAEGALRGAGGRPNVLVRYPNGIAGEFFYQKRAPASRPPWIEVVSLRFPSGRSAEEVVPRDAAALAWLANLACLELHPHPVRAEDLDHPDELRVDLDPVPGVTWPQIREVAHVVEATLRDFGLTGWPKTSGSRGMHVNVRIERRWSFDEVRRAALALAREVERRAPAIATSKWWKEERHGVFVDYNQNAKDRTVASAYSVRPKPDARVSAPLSWDEVTAASRATSPSRPCPRASPSSATGTRASTPTPDRSSRCSSSRPGRSARAGRRALAAALPEAGGRAPASAAIKAPRAKHPLIEIGRASARRTRWPDWSAGRRAIPRRPRISSRRMCWWTRCGAAPPPGRASG